MQFDDRLATVLRMSAGSAAGERTQFRQLLDLLGTATPQLGPEAGYKRLDELRTRIPADEQANILREPGLRLRNPQLIEFLAGGDSKTAASALATARLSESEWEALIPRLPVTARGLLRHRRDLPAAALRQLQRLGVGDLVLSDDRLPSPNEPAFTDSVLPAPAAAVQGANTVPLRATPPQPPPIPPVRRPTRPLPSSEPIADIIERIEQFRTARRIPVLVPRLPLGDAAQADAARIETFDAVTDGQGRVTWASANVAPWIVGMALTGATPGSLVKLDDHAAASLRHQQPLNAQLMQLAGAPAIAGGWRIDAAPVFGTDNGAFAGYRCRLMRVVHAEPAADAGDTHEEKMRQVLHELRTPVNAIQGFAEIIQQQLFGPVPHEYRAHAASIAGDAAKLLAGFEDMERLARLESGAAKLEAGETDLRLAVEETLHRLGGVLASHDAGFDLTVSGPDFSIALAPGEAMALCWRLLATATGALETGEYVALSLSSEGDEIRLDMELPAALRSPDAEVRSGGSGRSAVSAGMFGPQFAFRLATAEARAAGGSLAFDASNVTLTMPVLTPSGIAHSRMRDQTGD